eukprot:m.5626 g.5626  ORF g.5626 m.5626 type:complete len:324 (-) comp5076_c0_seq1:4483-5454(-)
MEGVPSPEAVLQALRQRKPLFLRFMPLITPTTDLDQLVQLYRAGIVRTEYGISAHLDPDLIDQLAYRGYFPMAIKLEQDEESRDVSEGQDGNDGAGKEEEQEKEPDQDGEQNGQGDQAREDKEGKHVSEQPQEQSPGTDNPSPQFSDATVSDSQEPTGIATTTQAQVRPQVHGALLTMLDFERCCHLHLKDFPASRSDLRNAKKFTVTTEGMFDTVFEACVAKHGENWLGYLRECYKELNKKPRPHTRFVAFGVYDAQGQLVAGDLGYTVGAIYTRLVFCMVASDLRNGSCANGLYLHHSFNRSCFRTAYSLLLFGVSSFHRH